MWFKNLQIYRLPTCWPIGIDNLRSQLERGPFVKCSAVSPMSRGWIAPRNDGNLVFSIGNSQWLIALKVQERLLPSSVINEEVRERAEAIEEQQGYAPGRKQLKELRERVTDELMPRAFTRSRTTFVWIDPYDGWIGIDASNRTRVEEVIEYLRHCLDDFPLKPVNTAVSATSAMADWLAGGEGPDDFTIDRDCQVRACSEEKTTVTYQRHPLEGMEEIRGQLAKGLLPTRLALTWNDRISFVLTEKAEIKRLAFLDLLKDESSKNTEQVEEQFDADFALMTGEFARFIPALLGVLGGEVSDLAEQGLS